jgi:enoyl-CoA hydratase/carnithine racemase
MRGDMPQMEEALALGLVDELACADELLPRAREFAAELAALPPVAMNQTRRVARAALVEAMRTASDVEVATAYWFSDETQVQMRALVARLAGR